MKIVSLIARILLGLVFAVFGFNHIHPYMPTGPMPAGAVGDYMRAMLSTGYLVAVGVCEVVPGLLLLINRFVPLALLILGPIIVNILLTDILMTPQGLPIGAVVVILWILTAWPARSVFFPLLKQRVAD